MDKNFITKLIRKQLKFQDFVLRFASGKTVSLKYLDMKDHIENYSLTFVAELKEYVGNEFVSICGE